MPQERVCEIDGMSVRYRIAGKGPATVFVHGLGGSWRWWRAVLGPLATRLEVHLVDLPGFGSARRASFTLAEAPRYLHDLIDAIALERPHLVGHSLGGTVCARVASLWPEKVNRLVLAAPAGLGDGRHMLGHALALARTMGRTPPSFLRMLAVDSLRAGPRTLYRGATQLIETDLRDELATITAPTLLLWGTRDLLVPNDLAVEYQRAIPGARLQLLERAGHVPMADRPAAFAGAVIGFLDGAPGEPGECRSHVNGSGGVVR